MSGTLRERFEDRIYYSPDGCHYWIAGATNGYGKISIEGRSVSTHRVAYILYKGSIPDDLFVLHTCDNGLCVNPDHLFLGTHDDNMADMSKKLRTAKNRLGMIGPRKDITGFRFGYLIAVSYSESGKWLFKCDCGNKKIIRSDDVTRNGTRSCGCKWKTHQRKRLDELFKHEPI